MKIIFATHEGVPIYGGGPYVKMLHTKQHLERLGLEVEFLDIWQPREKILACDLVHLFSANFAVYNLARLLQMRGVKFVVNPIFYTRRSPGFVKTIVNIDRLSRHFLRGMWWDWGFTRDICEWSEQVLPNTRDEGTIISRGLGISPEKIRVIYNGVSERFLEADPALFEQKYGLKNFILSVGHIGPARKNVLALVRALAEIDRPAVLITRILNTGETPAVLEAAAQNKRLLIIDGLANDDPLLASAYAACDVFVLPSQFETPGRAALEAALAGAKVVITPHGGTRDYFADLAEYVDPFSIQDIRRGIEKALNTPKTPALKTHIAQHFLWDKIARDTVEVYREVLER